MARAVPLAAAGLALGLIAASPSVARAEAQDCERAYAVAGAGTVLLAVATAHGGEAQVLSTASGFVRGDRRHVVTSFHVVAGWLAAERGRGEAVLVVVPRGGREGDLRRVLRVTRTNLAADVAELLLDRPLPASVRVLSVNTRPRVGMGLCAIGSPSSRGGTRLLHFTVTRGVLRGRVAVTSGSTRMDDALLLSNGMIWHGSSGGPVTDAQGRVVGVAMGSLEVGDGELASPVTYLETRHGAEAVALGEWRALRESLREEAERREAARAEAEARQAARLAEEARAREEARRREEARWRESAAERAAAQEANRIAAARQAEATRLAAARTRQQDAQLAAERRAKAEAAWRARERWLAVGAGGGALYGKGGLGTAVEGYLRLGYVHELGFAWRRLPQRDDGSEADALLGAYRAFLGHEARNAAGVKPFAGLSAGWRRGEGAAFCEACLEGGMELGLRFAFTRYLNVDLKGEAILANDPQKDALGLLWLFTATVHLEAGD